MAKKRAKVKPFPKEIVVTYGPYDTYPVPIKREYMHNGTRAAVYELKRVGKVKVTSTVTGGK